ncbi:MAG: LacI family DNA-binding transcriptional regulator [Acidimicrobiia bacterium]
MKHPTIHDVAARAGVSKSLVSLVMRGADNVSDEKRAAVLVAARALGYRPNLAARSLVRRRSQILGVLVSDLHNPFFLDAIDGIAAESLERDYRALLGTGHLVEARETLAIDTLLELRVDGLLLLSPRVPISVVEDAGSSVPTVVLGRTSRSRVFDSIAGDESIGGGLVVDHLVATGHKRIAHIHGGRGAAAVPRRASYERAMKRNGLDEYIQSIPGGYTEAGGMEGMRRVLALEPLPTAVFAANDLSALGALEVLDGEGIDVPGDMSLVGYDNLKEVDYHRIALTTVDQPTYDMGQAAVELVLERLEEGRSEAKHVVLPPSLVVRSTTAPPRTRRW